MAGQTVGQIDGIRELWGDTLGSSDITIAILDGPCAVNHPCLQGADLEIDDVLGLVPAGETFDLSDTSRKALLHGTYVPSLIFGNHTSAAPGIAPKCRGVIVPIFEDMSDGGWRGCSQKTLAKAIHAALNHDVSIINLSGSEKLPSHCQPANTECDISPELKEALRECERRNILVFAALGNNSCHDCISVPGVMSEVIGVGAMTMDGKPLHFSNWGQLYSKNSLLAPGEDIVGAALGEAVLAPQSGTSVATPIIAGVAAGLLGLQKAIGLKADTSAIRQLLFGSADSCELHSLKHRDQCLAGRLNIRRAVESLRKMKSPQEHAELEKPAIIIRGEGNMSEGIAGSNSSVTGAVMPACGCGGSGGSCSCQGKSPAYVYVVGQLSYDIRKQTLQDSMNARLGLFPGVEGYNQNAILDPFTLVSYLVGGKDRGGNLADLAAVTWVVNQRGVPTYAIRPVGAFSDPRFKALLYFFIEQQYGIFPFVSQFLKNSNISTELFDDLSDRYLGLTGGTPVGSSRSATGGAIGVETSIDHASDVDPKNLIRATSIAVPGIIVGQAELRSGQVVDIVDPVLRGLVNWSAGALVQTSSSSIASLDPTAAGAVDQFLRHLVERLADYTRNQGKSGQERAINFAASNLLVQLFRIVNDPVFQRFIKNDINNIADIWLDDMKAAPSPACRVNSECYDIYIYLFDSASDRKARLFVSTTVDVNDAVPAIIDIMKVDVVPQR